MAVELINIKIWGERVGVAAWDEENKLATFQYYPEFERFQWDLAPLKMPIENRGAIYNFPELRPRFINDPDPFKGLPGLLADVLPDRYGTELMNRWLASQGRLANSMNPLEKLCFIGTRGMGALEFEPSSFNEDKRAFHLEIEGLVTIAQKMLDGKVNFKTSLSEGDELAMMNILKVGTSAGGARPKAIIAYNEKTREVRSGQTQAPKGFEHWLLKLDGVSNEQLGTSLGWGRVEMAYYLMATACGIEMMPCNLLEENGRAHFMTKRFDREGGEVKHHIQTFCAMQHVDFNAVGSYSYEQLFQTMRELGLSYPMAEQLFRRMVFNVMARNCDDHTKNFSFRLKKNEKWELSPAYDVCYAYEPGHPWVGQHALTINGKRSGFQREDFLQVAKAMNIKAAADIVDQVADSVSKWEYFAKETGIDDKRIAEIKESIGETGLVN